MLHTKLCLREIIFNLDSICLYSYYRKKMVFTFTYSQFAFEFLRLLEFRAQKKRVCIKQDKKILGKTKAHEQFYWVSHINCSSPAVL